MTSPSELKLPEYTSLSIHRRRLLQERTLIFGGLLVIVLAYWLVAGLFAIRTPDWQTPDEPAHYNYIKQIAEDSRLPTIETGDWDQAYLDSLKAAQFAPELLDDLDSVQYEDHQPPLYYLSAAAVYTLTDGNLIALRLYSVFLGTFIVICAAGIGWRMFPERAWIGLGSAAFVAFQPMHVAILASVNNDSLGWAVVALTLFLSVTYVKQGDRKVTPFKLGLIVGIGFITKATTYMMAGVAGVAILMVWWEHYDERGIKGLIRDLAWFALPALTFGLIWWLRNFAVYGVPDFLGLAAHDSVVVGQPRTAGFIDLNGMNAYLREFFRVSFNSFWAQFGWMGVPLRDSTYAILRMILLVVFAGLGVEMAIVRRKVGQKTNHRQRNAWVLISLTTLLSILAFLYYNTEFQQFQGRYMFPLLIPLGLWLSLGLDGWRRFALRVWTRRTDAQRKRIRFSGYLIPLAFFAFGAWDIYLLWRVIVPNL
ncbi:MAG: DUF2142 domain-containing protein [Aggregatilineales bacterium]